MDTCSIYHYVSDKPAQRNKIFLPQNLFTFLEQGEKVVHYANKATTIADTQFALLSSGNCLMTEKRTVQNNYRSTMFFFGNAVLTKFFIKYAAISADSSSEPGGRKEPFLVFEKDEFIKNIIVSLKLIQAKSSPFFNKIIELKFEELMLHLLEKYPKEIRSIQIRNQEQYSDFEIRRAVEQNIIRNLTLEELAFLCHISVSTFKRRFLKIYNTAPSRYFLHRKMEMAAVFLSQNENPSDVFHKVGYESHSSFSQSFKQVYGITPKQFQQQKMIAPQQFLND